MDTCHLYFTVCSFVSHYQGYLSLSKYIFHDVPISYMMVALSWCLSIAVATDSVRHDGKRDELLLVGGADVEHNSGANLPADGRRGDCRWRGLSAVSADHAAVY